jgi:hypothetical protein
MCVQLAQVKLEVADSAAARRLTVQEAAALPWPLGFVQLRVSPGRRRLVIGCLVLPALLFILA